MQRKQQPIIKILKKPAKGQGIVIIKDLLTRTMTKFARINEDINTKTGAYPFEYSEKQMQSIMFSSFLNTHSYPYAEHPVRRRKRV